MRHSVTPFETLIIVIIIIRQQVRLRCLRASHLVGFPRELSESDVGLSEGCDGRKWKFCYLLLKLHMVYYRSTTDRFSSISGLYATRSKRSINEIFCGIPFVRIDNERLLYFYDGCFYDKDLVIMGDYYENKPRKPAA